MGRRVDWSVHEPAYGSPPNNIDLRPRPPGYNPRHTKADDEDKGNVNRRRSTVLEVRQSLVAGRRATDLAAEAAGLVGAGSETGVLREDRHQELPPAPFRGTFWDDDDGELTFPARRVSYDLHSGKRFV